MLTVTEALKAVSTVETFTEIEAILMNCDKVRDMVRVYEAQTQKKYTLRVNGVSREEVASDVTRELIREREVAKFKKLGLMEKLEAMKGSTKYDNMTNLFNCTPMELKELGALLGVYIPEEVGRTEFCPDRDILKELGEAIEEYKVVRVSSADPTNDVHEKTSVFEEVRIKEAVEKYHTGERIADELGVLESNGDPEVSYEEQIANNFEDVGKASEENTPDTVSPKSINIRASVGRYERGKLTIRELDELLTSAPAEALKEYILKEVVKRE